MRILKKITLALLLIVMIGLPIGALAQTQNFIPCGFDLNNDQTVSGPAEECDFADLLTLIRNILNWLVLIAIPMSIITFCYAGFILLTTGISDRRTQAKDMLLKVVIGFAVILAAWLIVKLMVTTLIPGVGDQFIQF
jgi:hypothetical protein